MQKWVICLFIAYRCSDIPKGDSNNMRYTGSGTFQLLFIQYGDVCFPSSVHLFDARLHM